MLQRGVLGYEEQRRKRHEGQLEESRGLRHLSNAVQIPHGKFSNLTLSILTLHMDTHTHTRVHIHFNYA